MKAILYGVGVYFKSTGHMLLPKDMEVVAYGNSDITRCTSFSGRMIDGKPVLSPKEIAVVDYDVLYVCTGSGLIGEVFCVLRENNIPTQKIQFLSHLDTGLLHWTDIPQEDQSVISVIDEIRIRQRVKQDFDVVNEIFLGNVYSMYIPAHSIVLDLGMNIGDTALFFAANKNVEKVYSYEPFGDIYQQALDNFALNKPEISQKILPYNFAVSDKREDIEVSTKAEWRSVFDKATDDQKMLIHCEPADEIIGAIIENNPGKNIILKMDIEGSEFPILRLLKQTDLLLKISAINMEYHREPAELISILEECGSVVPVWARPVMVSWDHLRL